MVPNLQKTRFRHVFEENVSFEKTKHNILQKYQRKIYFKTLFKTFKFRIEGICSKINVFELIHQTLRTVSPTSLKLTLHQLQLGANYSLGQCLQMEFQLVHRILKHHDFIEGAFDRQSIIIRCSYMYKCSVEVQKLKLFTFSTCRC